LEKAYLQKERRAKNGWVLQEHDIWFNFYTSNKVLDTGKAGINRISNLKDAANAIDNLK
jgi:hypothetical protein